MHAIGRFLRTIRLRAWLGVIAAAGSVALASPGCGSESTCVSDNDCIEDQICSKGVCRYVSCARDPECAPGQLCRRGTCRTTKNCTKDTDCNGIRCDVQSGSCVECLSEEDCRPEGTCVDGACKICEDEHCQTYCGDEIAGGGEECDGADLGGATCSRLGFAGGVLACTANCRFDTSGCTASPTCPNGVIDAGEECDGGNLGGATCASKGFTGGVLRCTADCRFDTSACAAPPTCPNDVIDSDEECDGGNLGGATCASMGFVGGVLGCTRYCRFDTSGCTTCPDGNIDPGEECDGANLGGAICSWFGFTSGVLGCTTACRFDTSGCWMGQECPICERGVCNPRDGACVEPWTLVCQEAGLGCAEGQPYRCQPEGPPAYDCAVCGCPFPYVCQHGVCYPPEVLDLVRFNFNLPVDLPLDDYFAIMTWAMEGNAISYARLVDRIDALLREDGRRVALLLGESHGSPDEQAIGLQLIRDVQGRGQTIRDIGIEAGMDSSGNPYPILDTTPIADLAIPTDLIFPEFENTLHCNGASGWVAERLGNDGLYVQYSGSAHTSQEICHYPGVYSICALPHTAECITRLGRKALTVILFDPEPWSSSLDVMLLYRLRSIFSDDTAFASQLAATISRWDAIMASQTLDRAYEVTVLGRPVNVRVVAAEHTPEVFIAFLPRPGRPAFYLRAYQAIYLDASVGPFLRAHALEPGTCQFGRFDDGLLQTLCQKDGFEVIAKIDPNTFQILEVTMKP